MSYLSDEDMSTICDAAITAGVAPRRAALLRGISPNVLATLDESSHPRQQVLDDLTALNKMGRLGDGSVPLVTWLLNASDLVVRSHESAVLRRLLDTRFPLPLCNVICASTREDQRYRDELVQHLQPLIRAGLLRVWHEGMALPGDDLSHLVEDKLTSADIVVLLLSPALLDDAAFSHAAQKASWIVPVLARPCIWSHFSHFHGRRLLPGKRKAASQLRDRDVAWAAIAHELRELLMGHRLSKYVAAHLPPLLPSRAEVIGAFLRSTSVRMIAAATIIALPFILLSLAFPGPPGRLVPIVSDKKLVPFTDLAAAIAACQGLSPNTHLPDSGELARLLNANSGFPYEIMSESGFWTRDGLILTAPITTVEPRKGNV